MRFFILKSLFQVPETCNEVIQCEFGKHFGQILLTSIRAGIKQKFQQQYTVSSLVSAPGALSWRA